MLMEEDSAAVCAEAADSTRDLLRVRHEARTDTP